MLRPTPSRWPLIIVLIGAGVLAGLALAGVLSLPKVVAFAPTTANPSTRAPLRLTFNRAMDQASIEAALTVTPATPLEFAWDGTTLVVTHPTWPSASTITVTLTGGRSATGLPLLQSSTWSFTVSAERLAYLSGAGSHLWLITLAEGATPQLVAAEPNGIYDFDLAPDGTRFVYAALRDDGGATLRLVNMDGSGVTDLLPCPDMACLAPSFSPDGARIAYERHSLVSGLADKISFVNPEVRVLTLATSETQPVSEVGVQARFPAWGPDGRLIYLDTTRQALVIRDLASQAVTYIPDTSGASGTWSPDRQHLVFPEIFFPPEPPTVPSDTIGAEHRDQFFSHLLKVEIATNKAQDLSGVNAVVEDASPVYSPDGAWLVFARRGMGETDWTPGRQIWLMRSNGSAAHALTAEPFYNHSAFAWSPDGRQIAYMRFNASDLSAAAAIWVINADGSGARQIVENAYLPHWVP